MGERAIGRRAHGQYLVALVEMHEQGGTQMSGDGSSLDRCAHCHSSIPRRATVALIPRKAYFVGGCHTTVWHLSPAFTILTGPKPSSRDDQRNTIRTRTSPS